VRVHQISLIDNWKGKIDFVPHRKTSKRNDTKINQGYFNPSFGIECMWLIHLFKRFSGVNDAVKTN
jgi:hypothetical protein